MLTSDDNHPGNADQLVGQRHRSFVEPSLGFESLDLSAESVSFLVGSGNHRLGDVNLLGAHVWGASLADPQQKGSAVCAVLARRNQSPQLAAIAHPAFQQTGHHLTNARYRLQTLTGLVLFRLFVVPDQLLF